MRNTCDLHTHSHFSDGTASPAEIISEAISGGLTAVALTDHNTVAGLPEFLQAAEGNDILAIPGVEISTGYLGKELHIVGLFLNSSHFGQITDYLSIINRRKEESNQTLIRNLNDAGYNLNYEEIRARHQGNINRAVIAAAMLEKGYVAQIKEAFKGPLSKKNGLYLPPERIPATEAIAFLKSIHVVPVLAHPYLNLNEAELTDFLRIAKPLGLAAMETQYSTYSSEITASACRMAERFDLLHSGGSDYHGSNKPDIHLGIGKGDLAISDTVANQLTAYHNSIS